MKHDEATQCKVFEILAQMNYFTIGTVASKTCTLEL